MANLATLKGFLSTLAREPFTYRWSDCAFVLGRWWAENHGYNPAERLTYTNREDCLSLLARSRGLLRLVWTMAKEVGAERTDNPAPGDFGVVRYRGLQFGAIHISDGKWAIKCSNGLFMTTRCRVLMAWSIEGCHN